MPKIIEKSARAQDLSQELNSSNLDFLPFPSHQTRQHLIDLTKRDLLADGKLSTITTAFDQIKKAEGFKLVVDNAWRIKADQHPDFPTKPDYNLKFINLNSATPGDSSEVLQVTSEETRRCQQGVKIYYDLAAIKKVSPDLNAEKMPPLLLQMMNAKAGRKIDKTNKSLIKKISPHILIRFESKQLFEYYKTKDNKGRESGKINILNPKTDKRAQIRPFYFNHMPELRAGSEDFAKFTDSKSGGASLKTEKISELRAKYQAAAALQLYVAAKNNEGCFFLEPAAFLHGLQRGDQQNLAKKIWLEAVFNAITEFEKRPDKIGKNLGRVFVQPSFSPSDIGKEPKDIKHLQVYFTQGLDCAKAHAILGGSLNIGQPVMGHALHEVGNGALNSGADNSAEENLYRQMAGLMALVIGPQNNPSLLDEKWLKEHSESADFPAIEILSSLSATTASSSISQDQAPASAPTLKPIEPAATMATPVTPAITSAATAETTGRLLQPPPSPIAAIPTAPNPAEESTSQLPNTSGLRPDQPSSRPKVNCFSVLASSIKRIFSKSSRS